MAGVRTYFHYADEGLIGEYDSTGTEIKTYGWKPGSVWTTDPLFMKEGSSYFFYHTDHLGTPQKMTAVNGAVVWAAKYSSFGEANVDAASTITNPLRFPGQFFDAETGLHYNWHRYYDSGIGRYLRVDPFGLMFCENVYNYGESNPINNIDPFGLWTCPTDKGKRGEDKCGSGEYGSSRDGGKREHAGIDYCGSTVYAPIGGTAEIIGKGYNKGVRITGKQGGTTYTVIIRHINVSIKAGKVKEGQTIGTPMSGKEICKGMKDHAHVEVYKQPGDQKMNPDDVITCD